MKKLFGLVLFLFCFTSNIKGHASVLTEIDYFLEQSEPIISKYIDEDGDEVTTTIERLPSFSRIAKGTYKISKEKSGAWRVSFHVSINSSKQITGTSNMSVKALSGSITSTSLTSNKTSATCKFTRKVGTISSTANVTATIKNGKLVTN